MSKYGKKDAAKDTGTSTSKVSEAWHDSRKDANVHSGGDEKQFESPPDWADTTTESGVPLFPDR